VTSLLEARSLEKRYGARTIFSDVDLEVRAGEITGLVGSNGAGKTTLLRILVGLVKPSAGSVARSVPEGSLAYFGGASTLPPHLRARTWVRLVSGGSAACVDRRRIRTLSRGSRQLFGLSAVLARRGARGFLLDEPWEGLDPDGARWLSETLRERRDEGCAFLVSSHRLHDLAGLCRRYAFLSNGRLTVLPAEEIGEPVGAADLVRIFDRLRCKP
jgi:ABC-type multidrug transport system ATPase subunit